MNQSKEQLARTYVESAIQTAAELEALIRQVTEVMEIYR